MLEKKGIEKDRFSGLKGSTGRGYSQPAQPVGEPVDRLPLSNRSPVEGGPKSSLSTSSFLFQVEVILFPVEVWSSTGRGNDNLLNAPTASEPVDP